MVIHNIFVSWIYFSHLASVWVEIKSATQCSATPMSSSRFNILDPPDSILVVVQLESLLSGVEHPASGLSDIAMLCQSFKSKFS